jgi:dUTP pyrophosphatase
MTEKTPVTQIWDTSKPASESNPVPVQPETIGDWAGHTPVEAKPTWEQQAETFDDVQRYSPLEVDIRIKNMPGVEGVPGYAKEGDAGADLRCTQGFVLYPFERQLVGTGVSVAIPEGFVGYIKPRSGLAHKSGIQILGGVIDSGYRGEIKVIMHNTAPQGTITFARGDRIAQLVIQPVVQARFIPVETLPEAVRGEGGFGSTGHN